MTIDSVSTEAGLTPPHKSRGPDLPFNASPSSSQSSLTDWIDPLKSSRRDLDILRLANGLSNEAVPPPTPNPAVQILVPVVGLRKTKWVNRDPVTDEKGTLMNVAVGEHPKTCDVVPAPATHTSLMLSQSDSYGIDQLCQQNSHPLTDIMSPPHCAQSPKSKP